MKKLHLLCIALLMMPVALIAQDEDEYLNDGTDVGLWASVGFDKKINKKLTIGVEGEMRLRDNMKQADRWSAGVDLTYKFTKWLKASAGYTVLRENVHKLKYKYYFDDPDEGIEALKREAIFWRVRHRFHVSVTGDIDVGRFNFSLRERWQYTFRPEKTVRAWNFLDEDWEMHTYRGKGKNVLRSRFQVAYDIAKCKVDPYANVELYNAWAINKIRYTAGVEWKITKNDVLDVSYRYQDIRGDGYDDEPDSHIIGINFNHKF